MSASYTTVSGYYPPHVSHHIISSSTSGKKHIPEPAPHSCSQPPQPASKRQQRLSPHTPPEQAHTQLKFASGALRFCSAPLNICGRSPTSLQMRMMRRFERMWLFLA